MKNRILDESWKVAFEDPKFAAMHKHEECNGSTIYLGSEQECKDLANILNVAVRAFINGVVDNIMKENNN